jgi:glutamate formiminotransferase
MLECVVNVSEGRDLALISGLGQAAGRDLLDVHVDPHHHRCVLTLAGETVEDATRAIAALVVSKVDIRRHEGVHPRIGALDVVPFVPLDHSGARSTADLDLRPALAARDRFAHWAAETLGLPCFLYGPERTLPDIRRHAFSGLRPDTGPDLPHPTAGACAVGARYPLVAYNLWLRRSTTDIARAIAASLRSPSVRALGLDVGGNAQVSCNLLDPDTIGPAEVYDAVDQLALAADTAIDRAELVGLIPACALDRIPTSRWAILDVAPDRTIEARLNAMS